MQQNNKGITKEDLKEMVKHVFTESRVYKSPIVIPLNVTEDNFNLYMDGEISEEELMLTETGNIPINFTSK